MAIKFRLSQTVSKPALVAGRKAVPARAPAAVVKAPPKGRAETAAEKAANETTGGLVPIKKSALSLDVGPRVIHALFANSERLDAITEEMHILKKSYAQLSELTAAITKAAKADTSIDLTSAFSGEVKQIAKLNNQLGIALGFRVVRKGEPDKSGVAYDAVVTSESVADCFPMPGEDKKLPAIRRKETFRSNFMTQLKKCAMAAHAIIENDIDARFDTKAGTLLISGPAVRKHFGQERVLLDERKTVGSGDAKVELSEKPSFTALANIGAASQGVAPAVAGSGGAQHRGNNPGTVGGTQAVAATKAAEVTGKESIDAAILTICKALRTTLEKAKELSKNAIAALEETKNAIDVRLTN
jgi:hypothetical protein